MENVLLPRMGSLVSSLRRLWEMVRCLDIQLPHHRSSSFDVGLEGSHHALSRIPSSHCIANRALARNERYTGRPGVQHVWIFESCYSLHSDPKRIMLTPPSTIFWLNFNPRSLCQVLCTCSCVVWCDTNATALSISRRIAFFQAPAGEQFFKCTPCQIVSMLCKSSGSCTPISDAGLVEADGTSIRKYKQGSNLMYRQLFGMVSRDMKEARGLKNKYMSSWKHTHVVWPCTSTADYNTQMSVLNSERRAKEWCCSGTSVRPKAVWKVNLHLKAWPKYTNARPRSTSLLWRNVLVQCCWLMEHGATRPSQKAWDCFTKQWPTIVESLCEMSPETKKN